VAGGDCLQHQYLVVDNHGIFIAGPVIVEIIEDNNPS
jgi:hypothetical protein